MGSASDRAGQLVRLIDATLEPFIAAETPTLYFPGEAKPVGPYATFGECVTAVMRRQDVGEEAARRICGAIEAGQNAKSATRADLLYLRRVLRATAAAQRIFQADLTRAFLELGAAVAGAWRELKQGEELTVELVIKRTDIPAFTKRALTAPYTRLYQLVGEATFGAVSSRIGVNVGWNLEDRPARQVIAEGGRRLGLVDLSDDTRVALFDAIHDGRSLGEGADALGRRIRDYVPAGRFNGMEAERPGSGVAYRSELIARTETTYSRNISGLAAGQAAGFENYLVFDARLGPTDDECEALNGEVVDATTARQLLDDEHPNGTRSISPVPRS